MTTRGLLVGAAIAGAGLWLYARTAAAAPAPAPLSNTLDDSASWYEALSAALADAGEQVTEAAATVFPSLEPDAQSMSEQQNIDAFLAMIRAAEGTAGPLGYQTIFGGQTFSNFADHPRVRVPFKQTDGRVNYSTAAGAYQFIVATWDRLAAKLGLGDFSPASQNTAALELVREAGALADVKAGRFDAAVQKCARTWASLPGSPYPQPSRTIDFVTSAYVNAGGVLA